MMLAINETPVTAAIDRKVENQAGKGEVADRKKGFGKGRSPTKFSFTYEDLAQAAGCSIEAARKHAQRGNYDPNDLLSVLEFIQHRLSKTDDDLSILVKEGRKAVEG